MARKVAVGIQDFGKVIQNGYFYVDKTAFIREWWESGDDVTLITRPRRFGKTLNMSMLEYFFSVKAERGGSLFQGLSVWKEEKYRALQGTYPVISLSLADVKGRNYQEAYTQICQVLTDLYSLHYFLLDSGILTEHEKAYFLRIADDMGAVDAMAAIKRLSNFLSRYYQKNVIILLDEYDTPLQEAYLHGYWEQLADFIKNMFNSAFKTNPWLERAVITGITRVSKESLFSDLNNLAVVTATSSQYGSSFGFTEKEVFAGLDEFGINEKETVKLWYDGFIFGECRDIYNPWSILCFLRERKFAAYWANTSSNSLAGRLIQEGTAQMKMVMEDLLQGKSFHTVLDEQVVFGQLPYRESAVWSLLLATGYLRAEHSVMDMERGKMQYELKLTNREVRFTFEQMIEGWFQDHVPAYHTFIQAMMLDDKKAMNTYMNMVAAATFSYFDTGRKPSETTEPERFYHGFVLGLMVDLAGRYVITSNRESGFGRYDVMLEPRNRTDHAFILEFKVHDPQEEKTMQETVEKALHQIKEKQYAAVLKERGIAPERIRYYGFAFEGKKVLIG